MDWKNVKQKYNSHIPFVVFLPSGVYLEQQQQKSIWFFGLLHSLDLGNNLENPSFITPQYQEKENSVIT